MPSTHLTSNLFFVDTTVFPYFQVYRSTLVHIQFELIVYLHFKLPLLNVTYLLSPVHVCMLSQDLCILKCDGLTV